MGIHEEVKGSHGSNMACQLATMRAQTEHTYTVLTTRLGLAIYWIWVSGEAGRGSRKTSPFPLFLLSNHLHPHSHPVTRHARHGHVVVDLLLAVFACQANLLKREAPCDHRQHDLAFHHGKILPNAVAWSVFEGAERSRGELCHVFRVEPA